MIRRETNDDRRVVDKSKAGFSLMELVVYMGIVGIVVIIAGEAFSNSTRFRIRTENMVKANQEAETVAVLFKEDVEQLGSKSKGDGSLLSVGDRIYMDPKNLEESMKDSSSFKLDSVRIQGTYYSDFIFKRSRYDDNGLYQAIDSIRWFVEEDDDGRIVLQRTCKVVEMAEGFTLPEDDPCASGEENPSPVTMATGISSFKVEVASPGVMEEQTQIFPQRGGGNRFILFPRLDNGGEYGRENVTFLSKNQAGNALGAGNSIELSEFWSNYENKDDHIEDAILNEGLQKVNQAIALDHERANCMQDGAEIERSDWKSLCLECGNMSFGTDTVYEISFIVSSQASGDRSANFVPSKDHMSVGFRRATPGDFVRSKDASNRVIMSDFMFYPPLDDNNGDGAGKRSMRFTVPEHVDNVCLAFTFAFYSPLASKGHVTIRDLKVSQVASANYKFNGFMPEADNNKKEKKNVKALKLRLTVSRGARNNGKGETGDVDLVIPIPSNGTGD